MKFLVIAILSLVLLVGCTAKGTTPPTVPNESVSQKVVPSANNSSKLKEELTVKNDTPGNSPRNSPPITNTTTVLMANTKFPEPPKFNFSNVTTGDGKLIIYYFYSPYCVASRAIRPEIDRLEQKYPELNWMEYDISTQNGTLAYTSFADQYNLSTDKRLVPQVLVNGTIITDRFNINDTLENIITSFKNTG